MRARAWVLALVAAVLATSVSPAGAAPSPVPTSILTVVAADAPPTCAGARAEARGIIYTGNAALAGATVRLQLRPYGSATFADVGSAVSDASGNPVLTTPVLLHTARLRWVFDGDATYAPTISGTWVLPVSTRVGIRVSDRAPRTGQRVVVRGHTLPAEAGHTVSLWRGTRPIQGFGPATRHWRLARGVVRADGSYRLAVRFATTGKRRIYVRVAGGEGNVAGYSAYRWLDVS